jgi:hypothetical protein
VQGQAQRIHSGPKRGRDFYGRVLAKVARALGAETGLWATMGLASPRPQRPVSVQRRIQALLLFPQLT